MEQTNQNQFKCSGDCLNCRAVNDRRIQWQYCAAQFSYNTLRIMHTMQDALNLMSGEIKELKFKLEAIQNSEAMVFAPDDEGYVPPSVIGTRPMEHTGTQEGSGVEQ